MRFLKLSHELIIDKNITSNEFRIYSYLLSLYNIEKECSYPSMEVISDRLNISVATVKRSIKKLAELGYITVEKRKGLAGNFNIYRKLKHIIENISKASKVEETDEAIGTTKELHPNIQNENIEEFKVSKIDNNTNVRLARSVTNIDKSNFAKKILSLADEELVREAIRSFKKKKGRNATFLIQMLVDEYYKAGIKFSQGMLNLLRKGLKFQNINQVEDNFCDYINSY